MNLTRAPRRARASRPAPAISYSPVFRGAFGDRDRSCARDLGQGTALPCDPARRPRGVRTPHGGVREDPHQASSASLPCASVRLPCAGSDPSSGRSGGLTPVRFCTQRDGSGDVGTRCCGNGAVRAAPGTPDALPVPVEATRRPRARQFRTLARSVVCNVMTTSSRWFSTSSPLATRPRSGFERERRLLDDLKAAPTVLSPGWDRSQASAARRSPVSRGSTRGEMTWSTRIRIAAAIVCQPDAIRPP